MNTYEMYVGEVEHLPRESDLPMRTLIEQARNGDTTAKQKILLALLRPILLKARSWKLFDEEMCMELAAIGNCTLVEHFDRLIQEEKPVARLMARAYGEMKDYLYYKHYLIRKPAGIQGEYALEFLPVLDALDLPETDTIPDTPLSQDSSEALYVALEQLSKGPRCLLIEMYGLYGEPCRSVSEIAGAAYTDKKYATVRSRHTYAIRLIRDILSPTYQQHENVKKSVPEYAHIAIPEDIRARLDVAYGELVATGVVISRNKLFKKAQTTPYYASAYLWQKAHAKTA